MWPKLEKCLISLGSGKYFFLMCLNAYDNLNTLPQTVKPAKIEETVFVDQFQLFPQVRTLYYVHVRIIVSYNNIKGFMKYFIAI